MNPKDFCKAALSLSGAMESAHMGHPDFRINGKIFATLGAPDENWAMVKLTFRYPTYAANWFSGDA